MKFVVVTGGVVSGLGKGITTSSIGKLIQSCGYKVTAIKIDPYLNYDAGTMNPYQHGEVFVLDDGGEVDLDLGNYERFLDINLTRDHNITTGKVYLTVIEKERRGDYLGKTVQIIPHITDEIKRRIKEVAARSGCDVVLIEVGGTVGDIESMPFIEALRQLKNEVGHENIIFIHTTYVPVLDVVGEQKTKPTQHSVKELRSLGIQPDVIVARSREPLSKETREKRSLFCDVPVEAVISVPDAKNVYEVPIILEREGMLDYMLRKLNLEKREVKLDEWKEFLNNLENPERRVTVAIVGKYVHLKDSYISHREAFVHVSSSLKTKIDLKWIDSETLEKEKNLSAYFENVDAILIPGGFGYRGVEGKINAIKYAREHKIPFLGVCLGFQLCVVEYARNILGYEDANSTEFVETKHPVIDLLPEQRNIDRLGGTMRLGAHKIMIKEGTLAHRIYGTTEIYERHRHRYEVNPDYIEELEKAGMVFSGKDEEGRRMEILELPEHPFFIASQFHPEYKSRPLKPSPLHLALIKAAINRKEGKI